MAQSFVDRHASTIAASVSCFDRVILKGCLKHLSHPSGKKAGRPVTAWFPLCKLVAYLYRYAEVAAAANRRYLDALAPVPQPRQIREQLHELTHTVEHNGRGYGGFNPAAADTIALFLEVMKGEHILRRFRNGTVAQALYGPTDQPAQK